MLGAPPLLLAFAATVAIVLTACSGARSPAGEAEAGRSTATSVPAAATGEPSPTAAPREAATTESRAVTEPGAATAVGVGSLVNVDRAFAHLRMLAEEIGPRAAGGAEERAAAAYLAAQLADAGYEVAIEPFPFTRTRDASAVLSEALDEPLGGLIMGGSAQGTAEGRLVVVPGLGSAEDFAAVDTRGAVALVARGLLPFAVKAANAARAGAVALLVVNNEPGELSGTLGDARPGIPVLGLSREAGAALDALAAGGSPRLRVRAEIVVEAAESQNVVGRPPGGACGAYLGAHYDSVPGCAGANDNASGAAAIVELARALRGATGAETLCVAVFGAEEIGLIGSAAFVAAHDVSGAAFMLNFDMVAKITTPMFVRGDAELAEFASLVASGLGESLPADDFPRFASSDHVSFAALGVPAITVHSGDDEFLHSPQDDIANVSSGDLARMLRVSEELARRLLAAGGVPRE